MSNVKEKFPNYHPIFGYNKVMKADSYGTKYRIKHDKKGGRYSTSQVNKSGLCRCPICHRSYTKHGKKVEYYKYAYMDHGGLKICPNCEEKTKE